MKKRMTIAGTLVGMMCIVAYVAISQTNSPKTKVTRKSADEAPPVNFASLLPVSVTPEFQYRVGPRFFATITKADLKQVTSVNDILPPETNWGSYRIQKVIVERLKPGFEMGKEGRDLTLTDPQRDMLRSFDYSESFRIAAIRNHPGELHYFITVVPEQEATYEGGADALMEYLKRNSTADILDVEDEKLEAGKIMFTVNTAGGISEVKLSSSSGYIDVDLTMIELVKKTAGRWTPATNAEGKAVDQELVFSFGRMGC